VQHHASTFYAKLINLIIVYFPSTQMDLRSSTNFSSPSTLPNLGRDLQTLHHKGSHLLSSNRMDSELRMELRTLSSRPRSESRSSFATFFTPRSQLRSSESTFSRY